MFSFERDAPTDEFLAAFYYARYKSPSAIQITLSHLSALELLEMQNTCETLKKELDRRMRIKYN